MKFYGSIAAGYAPFGYVLSWIRITVRILDPDYSPDPGSRHVFKIARQIALKVMDGFQ